MNRKDELIAQLKKNGCRITKQRRIILDAILSGDASCIKEIYYKAAEQDESIGFATVYRMVNMLEDIGAISRKNMYKLGCDMTCSPDKSCRISFEDGSVLSLSSKQWHEVLMNGLRSSGFSPESAIDTISLV
ncbi:MAG: transcriptional repressor [Eubacterium sp.]|nr:transcriptional repressor [Eubacterium sp.]SEF66951.1 Fur family transcriptional regulator, ferric uptake regulator [Eubacterium ruminantium]